MKQEFEQISSLSICREFVVLITK